MRMSRVSSTPSRPSTSTSGRPSTTGWWACRGAVTAARSKSRSSGNEARAASALCYGAPAVPSRSEAQAVDAPGRFEVAAGARWAGPVSMGAADATETAPGTACRSGCSHPKARSSTAIGLEGRVGVRVATVAAARGIGLARDADAADPDHARMRKAFQTLTLAETVNQWTIEAALVASSRRAGVSGRGACRFCPPAPAICGSSMKARTLVETGVTYQGGGGLNILLTQRAGDRRLKSAGVRRRRARRGAHWRGNSRQPGPGLADR